MSSRKRTANCRQVCSGYERIAAAVRAHGLDYMKPVFDALGGDVPYDAIRVAMAHLRMQAVPRHS